MCARVTSTYMEFTLIFGSNLEFKNTFKLFLFELIRASVKKNIASKMLSVFLDRKLVINLIVESTRRTLYNKE